MYYFSAKKSIFKFDKSATKTNLASCDSGVKEHRRNVSDASMDNLNVTLNASGGKAGGNYSFKTNLPYEKQREKLLICTPDQTVITKVYLPLMGYIQEIESFMKCKPG